jgi:hypothetical protein
MLGTALRRRAERRGVEFVEASATQAEFCGGGSRGEFPGAEATQDIADKRSGVAQVELAAVFIL